MEQYCNGVTAMEDHVTPARILIVEDQFLTAESLAEDLTRLGYEVVGKCANGDDALSVAKIEEPDLILMDIVLSGAKDGVATAHAIRQEIDTAIVFLTSHAEGPTVQRAMTLSPDGYLLKPVGERDLFVAVETAMQAKRGRSGPDEERLAQLSAGGKGQFSTAETTQLRDFIDRSFDKDIQVRALADLVGQSESYFSQRFRNTFNQSPRRYVEARRVEEAKRLLVQTNLDLSDIARQVGFASPSYFSTAFKRVTGVSPSMFRKI